MNKASERTKRWQKAHPEQYKAIVSRTNARRRADGSWKRWYLLNKYGITPEQWTELFNKQNNACAICETKTSKSWHTDHNHITGKVRGVLCHICNRIILPAVEHYQQFISKASSYITNS